MIKLREILSFLDDNDYQYRYIGDEGISINGFSSLTNYIDGNITWVKKQEALDSTINQSCIRLVVAQEGVDCSASNIIYSYNSKRVFFSIIEHFYGEKNSGRAIGSSTYLSPNVKLGSNVIIGHNCTLDGDIEVGDNTRIYNNVNIINKVKIGKNCVIQSCANIGHDGFGFTEDENHKKTMVKHYGGIIIGDNVYIGGSTCIERGTIDNTVIEDGTKIDVTCTIGHNSVIKKNSALVCGTILLGSVRLEENSYIASALIRNQGIVGNNAVVGMGSVVTKNVEDNSVVVGVPAKVLKKVKK